MSRIFVYDSAGRQGSAGESILPADGVIVAGATYHTRPVRLMNALGLIDRVGWEFALSGGAGAQPINFWQEFYGDRAVPPFRQLSGPGSSSYPAGRDAPSFAVGAPWMREQTESVAASGVITHNNTTRSITGTIPAGTIDSRYFPLIVHSFWVRLAIVLPQLSVGNPRLQVWAHVAGYGSDDFHSTSLQVYDYNHE